jgi:pyruvate formate lyase activating enzyme
MNENYLHEATYYSVLDAAQHIIRCDLCPHHCVLANNQTGICLVRRNDNGTLYTLNFCRPVSSAIDPIEKKPLYHFFPGSSIFSIGPSGCNFKCSFCQNHEISQYLLMPKQETPEALVRAITDSKTIGVAYTYAEPSIWFETIMAIAPTIKDLGLKNVLVTNGFIEKALLLELCNFTDAMNIDIKSMNPLWYTQQCKARLEPVLRTCELAKKHCHIEITNLVIPQENDSLEMIEKLSGFIAESLGKDTPLHFSRYFPHYKMHKQPTPIVTLQKAKELAEAVLDYVYIGNAMIPDASNTFCPTCKACLIWREGYQTLLCKDLGKDKTGKTGLCKSCGTSIAMIL